MPLIGFALASVIGGTVVAALGGCARTPPSDDEEEKAGRLTTVHGAMLIGFGNNISLDEFAIGFSLGLTRLPLVPVIVAIAVQMLFAAQFFDVQQGLPHR